MTEDKIDPLIQYHNIAHRLRKKRILKKPNVSEASQQFESLAVIFEREDLPHYSGLCHQAAAKCQNSLGNTLEEGLLLLKSSKEFMTSYLDNLNDQYVLNKSFLNHSYMHYKEGLARVKETKKEVCFRLRDCQEPSMLLKETLMSGIILDMANNLNARADLTTEACQEYEKALKLLSNSPVEKINCLEKVLSLKIEIGDYKECLRLVNEILEETKYLSESGLKKNILRDVEVTRIFLLLILQPTLQQISSVAATALEKYAWVETSNSSDVNDLSIALSNQNLTMLGEDLFLNLQSLVMACQYSDLEGLELLEKDLMEYLSGQQRTLLQTLIKQYKT